jgi:carbamoyltransferase
MLVLGITNNDTAGACLVEDDRILAAASEERFTRIKDHKVWPKNAIDFTLCQAGRSLSELDHVAYGWSPGFDVDRHLLLYVDRVAEEAIDRPEAVSHLRKRVIDEIAHDKAKHAEFDEFVNAHDLTSRAVYLVHHEAHALGGLACSPFGDALVLACDGRGDFQSLTISYYSGEQRRLLLRETSIIWSEP